MIPAHLPKCFMAFYNNLVRPVINYHSEFSVLLLQPQTIKINQAGQYAGTLRKNKRVAVFKRAEGNLRRSEENKQNQKNV